MSHCTVRIARPLRSYTAGAASLAASDGTLAEVLAHLDARCPGVRFRTVDDHDRIRPHMRLFVNASEAHELSACVRDGDTVHLVCVLAGD